ncbi:MAG: META domain-containing protein [Uliginosibacterium sp.]|nr:META domain-containing protein [Uliginosibacterium sp.]
MGSTSYASHLRTSDPENYWFEVNDERAVIQADCNKVSAKAMTTHEGRLWISNFASTKVNCPAGSLGAMFTKQLSQTQITEQRGQVLRISLSQYGDSMFLLARPPVPPPPAATGGGRPPWGGPRERQPPPWGRPLPPGRAGPGAAGGAPRPGPRSRGRRGRPPTAPHPTRPAQPPQPRLAHPPPPPFPGGPRPPWRGGISKHKAPSDLI